MVTILVTVRTPDRQPFRVVLEERLEFGREGTGVVVVDPQVSRRHVALQPAPDGSVLVTDLGSSNGTSVDGVVLLGPTRVTIGAVVQVGDSQLEIDATLMGASASRTIVQPGAPGQHRTSLEAVADAAEHLGAAEVLGAEDEEGTVTIVFSDIEASTQLAVALGDRAWFELLRRHHDLVSAHVSAHRGRIVKHQGDGYMLCFRSARSAILTSIGLQRDFTRDGEELPRQSTRVRFGLHTGEVLSDDAGDLFGKHVMIAARIGALAAGTEILVSSLVRRIVEPRGDFTFISPREVELRGLGVTETVYAVDWRTFTEVGSTAT